MLSTIWNYVSAPFSWLFNGARAVANKLFDTATFLTHGTGGIVSFIGQGVAAYIAGSMVGTATNAIMAGLSIFIGLPAAAAVALVFWGFTLAGVIKACFDPRYEEIEVTIPGDFEAGYVSRIFKELHATLDKVAAAAKPVDLRTA